MMNHVKSVKNANLIYIMRINDMRILLKFKRWLENQVYIIDRKTEELLEDPNDE